jgi:purine-binding chemotaxis protein CheW
MPDGNAQTGPAAETRQRFLTFLVGDRRYALPAERVAEVIRVPAVARLPNSPKALLGLANFRGSVIAVVSLPAVLGRPPSPADDGARAIILSGSRPAALVVDAVQRLVSPEAGRIETRQGELTTDPGEALAGMFPIDTEADGAGDAVVRILDIDAMLSREFGSAAPRTAVLTRAATTLPGQNAEERSEELALVSFEVAGQEYALALEQVQEVVAVPSCSVALVPRADAVVLGIIAHRDGLLPLLSLRALLGFPGEDISTREKVVVTAVGGMLVGLVADRMRGVIRADPELIEPSPPMLAARAGGEARIASMFRADGGHRLVSILSPDQLFREDVMHGLQASSGVAGGTANAEQPDNTEAAEFLVFRLGGESFGLPISAVDEVARVPDRISRVPNAPEFLEGLVNFRGEVLPVIDQRKRFGLAANDGGGRRLVVVRSQRHRAGVIVDGVSELLRAPIDAIEPAPDLIGGLRELVHGVVNLTDRGQMVLLLAADELLTGAEHELLDAFATATADQAIL